MEEKQAPGTTLIHSQPSQVGQQHWLKIQSARWLNFESAPTRKGKAIEVKPDAENDYTSMIHREMKQTVWQSGGCHSWYQSKSGHVIAMFPGFSFTFRRMCQAFKPAHHLFT